MPAAFEWLRRFNGFARFWVSKPSAFLWLKPFYASLFEWLTPFIAALFNFVEGFAVLCLRRLSLRCFNGLRRLNACGVSMAKAVLRFAV